MQKCEIWGRIAISERIFLEIWDVRMTMLPSDSPLEDDLK
jgi:hypothetical protein